MAGAGFGVLLPGHVASNQRFPFALLLVARSPKARKGAIWSRRWSGCISYPRHAFLGIVSQSPTMSACVVSIIAAWDRVARTVRMCEAHFQRVNLDGHSLVAGPLNF